MKVALVHDSITQLGGAERVLAELHEIYPDAPVFTLVYDHNLGEYFEGWKIISSPLQYFYNLVPKFQWLLPLIPLALKFFNFSGFDVVISSSSVFAKNINVPQGTMHINYCHTPARFLWSETESYLRQEVPALLRPVVRLYLCWMRRDDYRAAQRVSYFLANCENVRLRIKKYYHRDSEVLYPCIDLETFYPSAPKDNFYLLVSRLQAHKHTDLVVEAFNSLGLPLHVVGTGRDEQRLKRLAKDNIIFLGRVNDPILCREYSAAKALIFPQEEDFGLTPLEANAAGTPVVAWQRGGALETVVPDKTGVFFEQQTPEAIAAAVRQAQTIRFNSEDLFDQAAKFSSARFREEIQKYVQNYWRDFKRKVA